MSWGKKGMNQNWVQEGWNIRKQLEAILVRGWTLQAVDDGEEREEVSTIDEAMELIDGVDESWVFFEGGAFLFLVRGNMPWEVICDYSPALDPAILDFER